MLQTDLDAQLSPYDTLSRLVSNFRRMCRILREVADLLFPVGTVVELDHPRFRGIGIVVGLDQSPDHLVVELENGNRWSYELDSVTVASEENWPEWVRRRKSSTNGGNAPSSTEEAVPVPTISTGDPSTLGTYRRMAVLLTGENSPATKMLDERIASEGADTVVLQDESQMLYLIIQLGLGHQDNPNHKH